MSPTYAQQHKPVEDQSEAVGHAVRATYLYSAMADIAGLKQKDSYTKALHRIWADITDTRMHITCDMHSSICYIGPNPMKGFGV